MAYLVVRVDNGVDPRGVLEHVQSIKGVGDVDVLRSVKHALGAVRELVQQLEELDGGMLVEKQEDGR